MKKLLTLILIAFASYTMLAQKEQYKYDGAGNRNLRNTCTGCKQVHHAPPKAAKDTLAQPQDIQLAMQEGASVFPNPTQNTITVNITGYQEGQSCKIYVVDANGRIMQTQDIKSINTELDLSNLPPAVYYLKLQKGSNLLVYKVLKVQ